MASPWWSDRGRARRFVADLAAGELARSRRSLAGLPAGPWDEALRLDRGLGADSLETMNLAAALSEAIHLHRAGIEDMLLARRTLGDWTSVAQAGLERFSAELTFRTSGSTGIAKPCTHALESLDEEAAELARIFAGRRRILAAVPSHHIYGFLFTVLLPAHLGLAEAGVIDVRPASPAAIAVMARPGDLVVGHPDFWAALARGVPGLAPDVAGVTSTAPCPDGVAAAVARLGVALHQVYGASETAGIGWRVGARESYRLFPWWRRDDGEAGRLTRRVAGEERVFDLQDAIEWRGEDRFAVGARRDDAVQVGGVNVHPARVRERLLEHPQVRDAAVRPMRPEEGARLKAFIVPAEEVRDLEAFEAALRRWMDATLEVPQRPKAIRFGPAVPRQPSGKAADWDLA